MSIDNLSTLKERLFSLQDEGYRDFTSVGVPNMPISRIIGIRIPQLRALAIDIFKNEPETVAEFKSRAPHFYMEEETLHMFLIDLQKDPEVILTDLDEFLPTVTNWSTCDSGKAKALLKHPEPTLKYVDKWLDSRETYAVRYGIKTLMTNFLKAEFKEEYMERVSAFATDEYYVQMMVAWYFAESMVHQRDTAIKYFEEYRLEAQTHNTAIQKIVDSRRISDEDKSYVKTLRVPGGGLVR